MEQLFFLLIPLFASSSIISAGNDPNIPTTVPPNTTAMSPWSVVSRTEVQTEKTVTYTLSSQYDIGMTSHTLKTVSTTTAPVSSSHTVSTNGSSLSSDTTSGSTDGSGLSSHNTSVGVSLLPKTSTTANSNISMSEVTATPSQAPDSGLTLLAFGVMSLILILIVVMVVLVTAINLRGRCRNTKQHEGIKSCDSVVSDSNMTSNCEKESITLVSVRTINTENNTDSPQMSSVRSTIVDNDDQEFTRDLLGIKDGL
ncbi:endothelial cell-specific chemotaxis regulator-like isoform X3 [Sinocyclocheilus anshuiensis]|uniref:endothelial cell-specific chemotaxis regulator-like isoform X3 n=1 Tax=Sinocyclocheilus anshuiensis TaxID=1608454 RepID=UPI0007B85785|nr:PREDICTED: endothelial cell-specific chemotaxis regulator-like isoform X3 [Sinocyclocheilus anshuiensis]